MFIKKRRKRYRNKYTPQYKEKLKRELQIGYIEMGELNLKLAEEGMKLEE
ncbi:hypothetical protein [Anoxybacter fermentans]|nr:hypothetical protein [Anoxybacter fermentans]